MKGLLLAGGHGTRLRPLTFSGNKHMIPIANQPMLFYGLRHLADAGIREVGVVLGPLSDGIREAVANGSAFGVDITYIHQGDPRGLADAVRCARDFLEEDPFVMYLGDNLLQEGVRPLVERFRQNPVDAVLGVAEVLHPERYGVVELEGQRIISVVEKPQVPKSKLALIGVYLFTNRIHRVIDSLRPSPRGELEITDAIRGLNDAGRPIAVRRVVGWWKDTGRAEDLLEANDLILKTMATERFTVEGHVSPGATLVGPVLLGPGSRVGSGCLIEGPAVVGANVVIDGGARIGPATAVDKGSHLSDCRIVHSIVMERATIDGHAELRDSIVGRFSSIHLSRRESLSLSCILGDATRITVKDPHNDSGHTTESNPG